MVELTSTDGIKVAKRYIAFYSSDLFPAGGMKDAIGTFDTILDAEAAITARHMKTVSVECFGSNQSWENHWAHVYDTVNEELVISPESYIEGISSHV